jgi:hypothetical protein
MRIGLGWCQEQTRLRVSQRLKYSSFAAITAKPMQVAANARPAKLTPWASFAPSSCSMFCLFVIHGHTLSDVLGKRGGAIALGFYLWLQFGQGKIEPFLSSIVHSPPQIKQVSSF